MGFNGYFFVIREDDNKIIGIIDLRHTLNDSGNSGYSVRSSEKKGYVTEMLRLLLKYAKEMSLKELHLSVESDNVPSIKTIIKNDGKLERSFEFEKISRYLFGWIIIYWKNGIYEKTILTILLGFSNYKL